MYSNCQPRDLIFTDIKTDRALATTSAGSTIIGFRFDSTPDRSIPAFFSSGPQASTKTMAAINTKRPFSDPNFIITGVLTAMKIIPQHIEKSIIPA